MSPAKAGLLVGVFALLLVVYLGIEWRSRQVEEREAAAKRVLDVEADDVRAIRLERPGEPEIRIVREQGAWRVVAPRAVRTDDVAVRRIVDALARASRQAVLEGVDANAPDYGLAPPGFTVTLETESGAHALAFGADAPVGGGVFARRPGRDEVLVVPLSVRADAGPTFFDLRDKRVLGVPADSVTRVEVRPGAGAEEPTLVVVRAGDDWTVEGTPEGRETEDWKVRRVVDAATGMRMTAVASEDPGTAVPRGLARPARTVVVGLANGETRRITIGDAMGGEQTAVRVEGDPAVYLVSSASLEALGQKPDDLLAPPPTPSPSPSPTDSPAAK